MPTFRLTLLCAIILSLLLSACASAPPPAPLDTGNMDRAFRELGAEESKH